MTPSYAESVIDICSDGHKARPHSRKLALGIGSEGGQCPPPSIQGDQRWRKRGPRPSKRPESWTSRGLCQELSVTLKLKRPQRMAPPVTIELLLQRQVPTWCSSIMLPVGSCTNTCSCSGPVTPLVVQ